MIFMWKSSPKGWLDVIWGQPHLLPIYHQKPFFGGERWQSQKKSTFYTTTCSFCRELSPLLFYCCYPLSSRGGTILSPLLVSTDIYQLLFFRQEIFQKRWKLLKFCPVLNTTIFLLDLLELWDTNTLPVWGSQAGSFVTEPEIIWIICTTFWMFVCPTGFTYMT